MTSTSRGHSETRGSRGSRTRTHGTSQATPLTRSRTPEERPGPLAAAVAWLVAAGDASRRRLVHLAELASHVITPLGWVLIVGAPVALIFGVILGWAELVALGAAELVIVVLALLYLLGRPRITIALDLPHRRVTAGDHAVGRLLAHNPHARRSRATAVEVELGRDVTARVVPSIPGGEDAAIEVPLPTERRGVITVGPVRTVRGDPIGIVRRELVWSEPEEFLVHPRIVIAPSTSTGLVHDLEGSATRDLSVSDLAFHALRNYQAGDERRYIHWKSSAKTGSYMVRQFEESRRSHLAVALSLAPDDYRDEEEFELAVSVVGSLGVRAVRDARNVSVVVGHGDAPVSGALRPLRGMRALATHRPERLLDDLARIERAEHAPRLRALAGAVADQLSHVSLAFLVCGGTVAAPQLRAAAGVFPPEVRVVVVVCDPESEPGLRLVGGVDVLSVGLLDDLRHSLARTAAVS